MWADALRPLKDGSLMIVGSSTRTAQRRALFSDRGAHVSERMETFALDREAELEPQSNTGQVNVNVVAPSLAPEEPNVYSQGRESDDRAPEERNVPARYKSSNDISLLTELAEISWSSLFYKHSVPNGTAA